MALFRNFTGDIAHPYFAEVIIRGSAPTTSGVVKPILNVFHFRRLTNGSPAVPTDLAAAFTALISGPLRDCLNIRYSLDQVECRFMDDPASPVAVEPVVDGGALGDAASAYDLLSAVVFQCKTGIRGRSFKGSKHFSGLDESQITGDELTAAAVIATWADLRTALNSMVSGLADGEGSTWFPIVLSQELSSLGPTDIPGIFTGADITEFVLNLTIGTMRRRKEKTVTDE